MQANNRISVTRPLWLALLICFCWGSFSGSALSRDPVKPAFSLDRSWPPTLPHRWALGEVSAVATGSKDTVWVLHRPATVRKNDQAQAAPPLLAFDRQGRLLRAFGGPSAEYEWPRTEHSLAVDRKGRVWVSGSYRAEPANADNMILVFDAMGRFIRQIGRRGSSNGNQDTSNFGSPADIFVDDDRQEVYVADGYVNRRLIVLDSETGAFKRMWSAFGAPPLLEPAPSPHRNAPSGGHYDGNGPMGFNVVHGVEVSRDGIVYVSDRMNQRIQSFTRAGKYLGQVFVNRGRGSPATASGLAFSPDRQQRYLYVADFGNGEVLIYDRNHLRLVQTVGAKFDGPHLISSDDKGRVYVAEVQGRRVARLLPTR